jgi:di/tricarboxylate transporter
LTEQIIVFSTLVAALVLFINGRWRYDVVALGALFALVLTGVVSHEAAFLGFGHPAVVTVAGVLIISRGLLNGNHLVHPRAGALFFLCGAV